MGPCGWHPHELDASTPRDAALACAGAFWRTERQWDVVALLMTALMAQAGGGRRVEELLGRRVGTSRIPGFPGYEPIG